MRRYLSLTVLAVFATALSCSDSTEPAIGPPATLTTVGGDGQEAKTGSTLPDSLVVRVTDRSGNPVSGVTVSWQATRGGGAVSPSTRVTNAEGIAKSSWQLGDTIGAQAAAAGVSNNALRADYTATADPIDPPRAPAVRVMPGTTLGKDHFPIGNTREGGQGQTVSGIPCKIERIAYHIHPHVSLFFNEEQIAIPAGVGIPNPVVQNEVVTGGSCLYWIHTHDATGIIHVEPEIDTTLTLGQLFDIWGQPLTSDDVAGFRGPVTIYVDGIRYRGDPRAITFTDKKQIALYVGGVTPLPQIPLYVY